VAFFIGGQAVSYQLSGKLSSCARWTAEGGCPHIYFKAVSQIYLMKEKVMSSAINPEAATPSVPQAFEESDRNPSVTEFGGVDAGGGQLSAPASAESRVTQPRPVPSADAGLTNYDTGDNADQVQDEAEGEG
jgi:hypothetical protein